MWHNYPYKYTLEKVEKKLIDKVRWPYPVTHSRCSFKKNESWVHIVLKKEETNNCIRVFEIDFHFYFPTFHLFIKTKTFVRISITESIRDGIYTRRIQRKEQIVDLPAMREDSIYSEKQSETSITWSIHDESCEKNAQYVFDNIKDTLFNIK